ncbi:MAG: antA/AntB antirepressor family protein [Paraclostridium sp.]
MINKLVKQRENGELYVSAIELHKWLGLKNKFSNWKDSNVLNEKYGFSEHLDYKVNSNVHVTIEGTNISQIRTDYEMTLRMASHLSMVSKTKKGIECRDYFFKCENDLQEMRINNIKAMAMMFTHKDKIGFTKETLYPILDSMGVLKSKKSRVHQIIKQSLIGKYENIKMDDEFDTQDFIKDYKSLADKIKEEYNSYFVDKNQITIFDILEECI